MQITITPAGSTSQFALSGAQPAQGFQGFRIVPQSQVQDVLALGASDATQYPRGNKKETITFTTQFVLADAEAAAFFGPAFEAQFPLQGLLTYTTASGALYIRNALAVITQLETTGATCTIGWRVTGGGFYKDIACTLPPSWPDPVA